jgi:organic radical activating enzyme
MKPALFSRIIDQAKTFGVKELGLYATGEPFMHTDLEQFVEEAKQKGFRYVYISTNGGLATPARLKAVIDAGLDSIKFSINAGSRETYSLVHGTDDWDKVVENVQFISNYRADNNLKFTIFVSSIVTKKTAHEQETIEQTLSDFVDEIIFVNCDSQQGQMLANDGALFDEPSKVSCCSLPFNRLHVTSEGYLTLCCVDYQNYLAVADLNVEELHKAWNNKHYVEMRKKHMGNTLDGTLCGNCLSNRGDDIEPARHDLATSFDFSAFYKSSRGEMKQEIEKRKKEGKE